MIDSAASSTNTRRSHKGDTVSGTHKLGMSYLFICHDTAIMRHFADRVAVMREGRITGKRPHPSRTT